MNRRIVPAVGAIAVVALLGLAMAGVVSASGPWWMQDDDDFRPPCLEAGFECPEDCPYDGEPQHRNFVDENDDGINDDAGMGRWDRDDEGFAPRSGAGRSNSPRDDVGFPGGGRQSQGRGRADMPRHSDGDFGPGRWNQGDDNFREDCDGDCGCQAQGRGCGHQYNDGIDERSGAGRGGFRFMSQ